MNLHILAPLWALILQIHAVVANGRLFDRSALDAMLSEMKERAAR